MLSHTHTPWGVNYIYIYTIWDAHTDHLARARLHTHLKTPTLAHAHRCFNDTCACTHTPGASARPRTHTSWQTPTRTQPIAPNRRPLAAMRGRLHKGTQKARIEVAPSRPRDGPGSPRITAGIAPSKPRGCPASLRIAVEVAPNQPRGGPASQ